MWVLTVSSLRPSSRAATVVDSPLASSCRISRWRRVSLPRLPFGGTAGSTKLSWASGGVDRARSSSAAGGAGDVGAGAGLQRGVGEVALGPLAVGDDAEPRRRRCAASRIVSVPLIEAAGAVLAPAHVDDRDVEAADVADQVDRLLAAGRLVDLEAVLRARRARRAGRAGDRRSQGSVGARSGLLPIISGCGDGAIVSPGAPIDPILAQAASGAVERRCDLDHLEVALRGRRDGRAGALRRAAGADQGAGRAPRDPRAVPRAALLDPAPRPAC